MKTLFKRFKGTPYEYFKLHTSMRLQLPRPTQCKFCCSKRTRFELANISQKYLKNIKDWMYLCPSCHKKYDSPLYKWFKNGWKRKCKDCLKWKSVTMFYMRKAKIIKNNKEYHYKGHTQWCIDCTKRIYG